MTPEEHQAFIEQARAERLAREQHRQEVCARALAIRDKMAADAKALNEAEPAAPSP